MEYAISKITDKLVSAKIASKFNVYICPVCQKPVSCRSGPKIKPYFAHMPGVSSKECENFVPAQNVNNFSGNSLTVIKKWEMELLLQLPIERNNSGWFLELLIPKYRSYHALMKLDVGGGRTQTIDMRGMDTDRRVMVEFSKSSYRIIEFIGKVDPDFISNLDKECLGLPISNAAVFFISKEHTRNGFSRAQVLKNFETYALLWQESKKIHFPEELMIEVLSSRNGWNLVLVKIPDEISLDSINWLSAFTGLPFEESKSSINLIWPFIAKRSTVHTIESIKSDNVLFSVDNIPSKKQKIILQNNTQKNSILPVSPSAFFKFEPGNSKSVSIENRNDSESKENILFSTPIKQLQFPLVELAFKLKNGENQIVSLHQRSCLEVVLEARKQNILLEYISMPVGAKGKIFIEGSFGTNKIEVNSGDRYAPHDQLMRIPSPEIVNNLSSALANSENHVTIDFNGFGSLHVAGTWNNNITTLSQFELSASLRFRLFSFLLQLNFKRPLPIDCDDNTLVNFLSTTKPELRMIPHYRLLMKEVFENRLNVNEFQKGVLR